MTSGDLKTTTKDTPDASEAAASAEETAEDAGAAAVSRAQTLAGRVADAAHDVYETARESAADLGGQMPHSAEETLKAGQRAYARGSETVERQVTKQPIEALLLAGAIGYLVGWAANRV